MALSEYHDYCSPWRSGRPFRLALTCRCVIGLELWELLQVNLLTSLVPGLRDLRTPLAVGYLWFSVVWVVSPSLPSNLFDSALHERIAILSVTAGPAGQLAVLSFAAYLLGVLLEVVNRLVVTVVTAILKVILNLTSIAIAIFIFGLAIYLPIQLALLFVHFYYVALPVLIVLLALFWTAHMRLSADSPIVWRFEQFLIFMRELPERLIMRTERTTKTLNTWARPGGHVVEQFLSTRMSNVEPVEIGTYFAHLKNVSPSVVRYLARILKESPGVHRLGRTVRDLDALMKRTHTEEMAVNDLRLVLAEEMARSSLVRARMYSALMDSSEWYELIDRELTDAATQLRARQESLHSDYDRSRAESDFRLGVMVPAAVLAACLTGSALSVKNSSMDDVSLMAALVVGALVMAVLYIQGYRKRDESNGVLISSIEANVVQLVRSDIKNLDLVHVVPMSSGGMLNRAMTPLSEISWMQRLLPRGTGHLPVTYRFARRVGEQGFSIHSGPTVPLGVQQAESDDARAARPSPAVTEEVPGSRTPHG